MGCEKGSYTIRNGNIVHENNIYKGEYEEFDGYVQYFLKNIDEIHFEFSIVTKSGDLKIYVLDENEEVISSIDGASDGMIKKKFSNKQTISIKLVGYAHEGSYLLELVKKKRH